jgi:hypothetical protein
MKTYTHQVLSVAVAQICQTIGWQSITTTSLEILVDILERFIKELCKTTHNYSEHCKFLSISSYNTIYHITHNHLLGDRTEANINDLELAFRDMGINMTDVIEYISFVDPILPVHEIPKIPISKDSHFNFLKPGSKEVLTRPVHIHEHLPPINPPEDEPLYANGEKEIDVVGGVSNDDVFKRPTDSIAESSTAKKIKSEEEGRATREISSVMMTTSGFISPAREGKAPESRPPKLQEEFPKPVPIPIISPPPYKSKEIAITSGVVDKKLEKKLKKKNHEKERKKEKHFKDRAPAPDIELEHFNRQGGSTLPQMSLPYEANEDLMMAERKKELKKLKMKNKEEKKKKIKPPKIPKNVQSFDAGFIDTKPKFDPFQVLPTNLPQPPTTSSQIQAHNYLTGAAHSNLFPNPLLDQNIFGTPPVNQSLLSANNPLIEGKLVSEPDKNKLNIFKKIQRAPKDDLPKASQNTSQVPDFLSPSRFDQLSQPAQQIFNDPMKKIPKLPKETTLTRIDDNLPMNLSNASSGMSTSFDEIPKTPTIPIPRTPEIMPSNEKKEKKERKKREKKVEQHSDWAQQGFGGQNPFDLAAQNNPFLQSLQQSGLINNPFVNAARNPFSTTADIFPTGPSLIPRANQFSLSSAAAALVNPYGFGLPNMDMNLVQNHTPSPKKVKQPKQPVGSDFLQMGSKLCNVASLMPPSLSLKERSFDPQSFLKIVESSNVNFPLQQQQAMSASFDQLLKDQMQQSTPAATVTSVKKFQDEKVETYDLTKDSSPEPQMNLPMASNPSLILPQQPKQQQQEVGSSTFQQQESLSIVDETPVVKEKSKEKKKKKDKDKDKERDKDKEERKKVRTF